MTKTTLFSEIFAVLCGILFIVRNIYFVKLWFLKDKFENEKIFSSIFDKGVTKYIYTIDLKEPSKVPIIEKTIYKINILTICMFLSMFLSFVGIFIKTVFK